MDVGGEEAGSCVGKRGYGWLDGVGSVHSMYGFDRHPPVAITALQAYNLSAGMFTKAGSGYSRRNLLPAGKCQSTCRCWGMLGLLRGP